jgi:hypothetical protein
MALSISQKKRLRRERTRYKSDTICCFVHSNLFQLTSSDRQAWITPKDSTRILK